ncbi:hypothetical protein OC834_003276 [Tilletia horrida]|nr:hypothetical protein OC834_003276 [Tilletia horrida]
MTWPPAPAAQMEGPGNMAGFGARKMQEEQQREAERRQQEWEQAEAERRQHERLRQQEIDRQNLELDKQRLAWEWSELQRQQREHEEHRLRFQQEQAYAAEQQRLHYEQEQQRLYQQQQQQFIEQQQHLEQQQELLQRQQRELQQQQQLHQDSIAEQQRKLRKAEVELQRKLRSQAVATQKLQEELQQQQQLQAQLQLQQEQLLQQQQRAAEAEAEAEVGDETLQAIPESYSHEPVAAQREARPKKASTRPRLSKPESVSKTTTERTKAWAEQHAETMLAWCGNCQQDVLMAHLGNHHCMRRNHSGTGSSDSTRTTELVRPSGLSAAADARTPSPAIRSRSPFFERHLELDRERSRNATYSPRSPALSPLWPEHHGHGHGVGRSNSNDGPLIRRTPSEDERERLISTPSPIPPDLSPEEEADIRAERKRRIEAQREAKKKGSAAVAATAIIAALKFDGMARAATGSGTLQPPRAVSPSPAPSAATPRTILTESQSQSRSQRNGGLPLDKFPSNSSLASTQSSLLSADRRPYQRDRAYSGSSAVMTPSTSYEFSNGGLASPDLLSSSSGNRLRAHSNASHKTGAHGSSALRNRADSVGAVRTGGRSRLEFESAASSSSKMHLHVDTSVMHQQQQQAGGGGSSSSNARSRLDSGNRRLELVDGYGSGSTSASASGSGGSGRERTPSSPYLEPGRALARSPVDQFNNGGGDGLGLSPAKSSRSKSSGVVPRKSSASATSTGTGGAGPTSSTTSPVTATGVSPQLKARSGGTTPRPPLPLLRTSDRARS